MRSGRREVDEWGLQSGWLVGGVIYYEYGDGYQWWMGLGDMMPGLGLFAAEKGSGPVR